MGRKTMTMRDLFIDHRIGGRFLSAGDVVDSGIIDSFTGIDPMDVADGLKHGRMRAFAKEDPVRTGTLLQQERFSS